MLKAIFSIEDSNFSWKQQFEVKNNLMIDLFITNMQLFTSQDVNWWTGMWITCGFISCLDSHSDGTHSLQKIHWWAKFSKTVLMKKQTHLHFGWPEGVHICSNIWVSYSFKNRYFKSLVAIVETLFVKGSQEERSGVQLLWKPRCKLAVAVCCN